mgnify:CR=1 FL=1
MKEKPKMYQNKIDKKFDNNRYMFMSNDRDNSLRVFGSNDIRKKINDIINSNTFIYRTKVNIVIDGNIVSKKVIGVYNNNLVTIDNEHIPIDKIQDIYK